ncbi:MAG: protein-L-isoaspartate O-methyltransferase [bacterium]|nr:protein-L-isoaspartate O-methyltransferase [bacterium]
MPSPKNLLIQSLISEGYLKTPRIIAAFKAIDRKDFLPRGREAALRGVPPNLGREAYGNYPLPIGHGQTISQPLTVAFMLELLEPKLGEKILDVGSGSGWTTALLASVVGEKGRVIAVERISGLCKFGEKNVKKYFDIETGIVRPHIKRGHALVAQDFKSPRSGVGVKFFCGDASRGLPAGFIPKGGFDKILAGAAATDDIPEIWKKMLKIGGRIVAPVGQSVVVLDKIAKNKFATKEYFGFSFVPLIED